MSIQTVHSTSTPKIPSPAQLTLRAVITGMLIGGTLSLCNVYMGLKIGWGINMSITATLLSYGIFQLLAKHTSSKNWGILENNINQTTASAAASISSAGLVAPIPAWSLLTGKTMSFATLCLWTFSVASVGVIVAIGLRKQMLVRDQLAFPNGIATGETLLKMYAQGKEALIRVKMLLKGMLFGIIIKLILHVYHIKNIIIAGGISHFSFKNLTVVLSPSPLFVAIGALIGTRAALSLLVGAISAWCILAPIAIHQNWIYTSYAMAEGVIKPISLNHSVWIQSHTNQSWFKEIITWLLWPGVSMMVFSSLTAFSFSWRSVWNSIRPTSVTITDQYTGTYTVEDSEDEIPKKTYLVLLGIISLLSIVLQVSLFGIGYATALLAVGLSFLLAIVASRVSGETGITPVGAMGKVTQLTFAAVDASHVSTNLMTANVTGGAASQCADLLHDMKAGLLIGASPRQQSYAQFAGIFAGAICGSFAYLVLVGDLQQLQGLWDDPEWAMPAVVQWKAVAELFRGGLSHLPTAAIPAMIIGGLVGILLAILEKVLPQSALRWIPSPTAVGLAFVIPAYYSISMAFGGVLAWGLFKFRYQWAKAFVVVLAAGVIAGDSLTGVVLAMIKLFAY
jgi:OPT family oligopeptide transporter